MITRIDPVTVVGIGLSLSLSITLDVTGWATGVESLLAGLLGIVISLHVESIARAERRFQLRSLLEGAPWLGAAITPVVEGTREAVETYPGTPIAVEARRRYERLQVETEQLRRGRIIRPHGDYQDMLAGIAAANESMDATSSLMLRLGGEVSWWNSPIGRHYWRLNCEALHRGVQITRLFAYTGDLNDDIRALLDEQRAAGVRVGLLEWAVAPRTVYVDMAIWDGSSAWKGRMGHGDVMEHEFTVNQADLEQLRAAFASCRSMAQMLD
jgi:hypothetical protein